MKLYSEIGNEGGEYEHHTLALHLFIYFRSLAIQAMRFRLQDF